ncbi:MAG: ccmA [Devosia sp.]|uniref:heme ABC exporter ATP-binding protein CcmA n=1 Tax=Devosia sp. TaxID=1871048 RepID=UPI002633933C|nr:heme ABC exporter ATP-binding protein CcmA [Devosia sp.]MDB5589019.1 ccmA [Devosia sp.]
MTERQVFGSLALSAHALAVGRGGIALAQGLEFKVQNGKCLLLRGPNGVGKSTLLLTLAGIVEALDGSFKLEGPTSEDGPLLHYCGHRNAIKPRLSVLENLDFWAQLNGPTGAASLEALETVGLDHVAGLDAGYLSAGQGRRLALARLLVSARPLWLLDEPTAALDTEGHDLVTRLIDAHLEAGGLVVAATHDPITPTDPNRVETLVMAGIH